MVLGLVIIRLMSRLNQIRPTHIKTHQSWERILAKLIHGVFYLSFIGMPLSGWVMSSAGEFPVNFFGLFEMPPLSEKNEQLFERTKDIHEIFAFIMIAGIGLHIIGALKHHIIDRDETLKRMGGNLVIAAAALLILLIPTYYAAQEILEDNHSAKTSSTAPATESSQVTAETLLGSTAPKWVVNHENSVLNFTFTQYGQDITGHFDTWNADIAFDAQDLANSAVTVTIDIASIKTGAPDRDTQAKGNEWFDVKSHPKATFTSESFEELSPNHYRVQGRLSLHGVQLPLNFPFSLNFSENKNKENQANFASQFTLDRLKFNIGQGQWESTDAIGNTVKITTNITAHPASNLTP